MVVYSNSKVMAQYQQLLNDLLKQIDRQNRAIEQQTELAAMQAGFIRSGNVYIKQSKLVASAIGMVEAYQWFDGKTAFDDYLSSLGDGYGGALVGDQNGSVTHKSRDEIMADLPAFLETADTVQVESFFAVQKMILQNAFAKIMGTGSASERQNSRDKNVIGDLAGSPAGSHNRVSSTLDQENPLKGIVDSKVQEEVANLTYKKNPTQALDVLKYLGDPGFGELGAMGNRPSGIYLGFYNKLDIVSRYVDGKDADKMSQIAGSIDPISATLNQFNPVVMLSTAVQNVRVASEVYGTGHGYMWEAQLLSAVKTPLRIAGSMLVAAGTAVMAAAGWTGIGALIGGAVALGGAVVSATANSIHVDAKSGKRSYQMTDEGALATVTDVVGGALGGYASYAEKTSNAAAAAQAANTTAETVKVAEAALATAQTAQRLSQGGSALMGLLQSGAEFDSSGRYTGYWSLGGARGDAALTSTVASAISAEAAGAMGLKQGTLASDLTKSGLSTGMNMMVQYQKMLAGHENSYAAMAESDFSDLGGVLGTVMQSQSQDWQNQLANSLDRTHRASDSLAGLGVFGRRDDEYKFGDGIKSTLAGYGVLLGAVGSGIGAAWDGLTSVAVSTNDWIKRQSERFGNLLMNGKFMTESE